MSRSESMGAGFGAVPRENLTPWEELQLVRRQIAKLNHRLMALELENQQQQQRETILTVVMSVYFIGKFFLWMHRSLWRCLKLFSPCYSFLNSLSNELKTAPSICGKSEISDPWLFLFRAFLVLKRVRWWFISKLNLLKDRKIKFGML